MTVAQPASLEEMIDEAVAREDVEALRRLRDSLSENAGVDQAPGEMAEHVRLKPTPEVAAAFGLDPVAIEESARLLNIANVIADAIRRVEFARDKRDRPHLPTLVAEGDSWFLHQLIEDTLDHLRKSRPNGRDARFNVRSLAAAGDTVDNMLGASRFIDTLREEDSRVFLFSGGGNDLLGNGHIRDVVRSEDASLRPEQMVNEPAFQSLLGGIMRLYSGMLRTVAGRAPGVQVFSHGYDRIVRVDAGPWIWPYLQELGYSKERAIAVVGVLLDRFNEALAGLARQHANFTYVDLRGTVGESPASWHDAIHPRSTGFGKVAEKLGDAVQAFLDQAPARGGFGEAAVGDGLGARLTRAAAQDIGPGIKKDITRAFSQRNRTDFQLVQDALRSLPPEDRWIRFRDPLVHKHIKDVISLLFHPGKGQTSAHVETRMRTRPDTMNVGGDAAAGGVVPMPDEDVLLMEEPLAEFRLTEALFGSTELEPIQVMLKGYEAGQAVGRVQVINQHGTHVAHGSGFLVGPGLFLTNHHVLPDEHAARRSFVIFEDETSLDGSLPAPVRFRITDEIFWACETCDYAFVSVEPVNYLGKQLAKYGHLQLIQESGKALIFEPVSIIQHPGGDPKAIAIRNSFIMGRIDDGVYYTTDTQGGSSGSPVLNREWQVVALHHRYVPHPVNPGGVIANRGVRISAIYADLYREQGLGNRMAMRVLQRLNAERVAGLGTALSGGREEMVSVWPEASPADMPPVAPQEREMIESGIYCGSTFGDFAACIAREDAPDDSDIPLPQVLETGAAQGGLLEALPVDPDTVLRRIGGKGYRMVVGFEVSSRANYEQRLRNPILPGGASGVTIGIGYDLGHVSLPEFRSHWADLLPPEILARLEVCIGRKSGAAAAVLTQVRDVSVPYDDAIKVFERSSLPKVFAQLNRHVRDDVLASLAPPCIGALMSLTYNRGPSFQASGDRFQEMRAIRAALNGGAPERVPDLIRAMKRLWEGKPNLRGLLRRRDAEADLFAEGLALGPARPLDGGAEAGPMSEEEFDPTPDVDEQSELLATVALTEAAAPRRSAGDVSWVNTYSNNPDYAHLPASAEGARFRLDAALIESAIALGHYRPHVTAQGNLIVAIRGAGIESGETALLRREAVTLTEQKPDHRTFRCVIAVYHRAEGRISAFLGSSVPNRGGVASCANLLNGFGGSLANLLPTGCYELCVGTHFGTSATVPTVLRLGKGPVPADALTVTTLRTRNDAVYGTMDLWDTCKPADNVHPAFSASTAEFSSLGCLTLPGSFRNGQHSGIWAQFRETAGFDGTQHLGTRYDLLLTTGMELAAISRAPESGRGELRRLSHGSFGTEVAALQAALGVSVDRDFGPGTKKRLTEREAAASGGASTGIYSLTVERSLGFGVL